MTQESQRNLMTNELPYSRPRCGSKSLDWRGRPVTLKTGRLFVIPKFMTPEPPTVIQQQAGPKSVKAGVK